MTNDQARALIAELLELEVPKPGPVWVKVIDLCLFTKAALASGKLSDGPKVRRERREYMRIYMRRRRAVASQGRNAEVPKVTIE